MSAHVIRWTFDDGYSIAEAVCNAGKDADCRLTSMSCECEQWGEIQRRDDGTIWHKIVDYGDSNGSAYPTADTARARHGRRRLSQPPANASPSAPSSIEPVWHEIKIGPDCNVCLFINESGCVEELGLGAGRFVIGEVPIKPVWNSDGCEWEVESHV